MHTFDFRRLFDLRLIKARFEGCIVEIKHVALTRCIMTAISYVSWEQPFEFIISKIKVIQSRNGTVIVVRYGNCENLRVDIVSWVVHAVALRGQHSYLRKSVKATGKASWENNQGNEKLLESSELADILQDGIKVHIT